MWCTTGITPPREDCRPRATTPSGDNPLSGELFLLYTTQGCHICIIFNFVFFPTFTCHFKIPLDSDNECSLGSGKGRHITKSYKILKRKFCCFWKTVGKKYFFLLFLEIRWRFFLNHFLLFFWKNGGEKKFNLFSLPNKQE